MKSPQAKINFKIFYLFKLFPHKVVYVALESLTYSHFNLTKILKPFGFNFYMNLYYESLLWLFNLSLVEGLDRGVVGWIDISFSLWGHTIPWEGKILLYSFWNKVSPHWSSPTAFTGSSASSSPSRFSGSS